MPTRSKHNFNKFDSKSLDLAAASCYIMCGGKRKCIALTILVKSHHLFNMLVT